MPSRKISPGALQRLKAGLRAEARQLRVRAVDGTPEAFLSSVPEVTKVVSGWRVRCYWALLRHRPDLQATEAAGLAVELSRDTVLLELDAEEVAIDACRLLNQPRFSSTE